MFLDCDINSDIVLSFSNKNIFVDFRGYRWNQFNSLTCIDNMENKKSEQLF